MNRIPSVDLLRSVIIRKGEALRTIGIIAWTAILVCTTVSCSERVQKTTGRLLESAVAGWVEGHAKHAAESQQSQSNSQPAGGEQNSMSQSDVDEFAAEVAKDLPMMVDEVTKVVAITSEPGLILRFRSEVALPDGRVIQAGELQKELIEEWCDNKDYRDLLDLGVVAKFEYVDPVGHVLSRHLVSSGQCSHRISLTGTLGPSDGKGIEKPSAEMPPQPDLAVFVGQHPVELLKVRPVEQKLAALLGQDYEHFVNGLSVSTGLQLSNDYYVGAGCAPHSCGIDEAAFAMQKMTGKVIALQLIGGEDIKLYGVSSGAELPFPLYRWYKEHGGPS